MKSEALHHFIQGETGVDVAKKKTWFDAPLHYNFLRKPAKPGNGTMTSSHHLRQYLGERIAGPSVTGW